MYSLSEMQAEEYFYADISFADTGNNFHRIEENLSQDIVILTPYFQQ